MKFVLTLTAVALAFSLFATPAPAHAQLPFGGPAIFVAPCNTGFLYMVPPYGMFMFLRPPLGLNVLGLAALAPAPCILGIVPIGFGFPVLIFGP